MDKIVIEDAFVLSQNVLNTLHWSKKHKIKNEWMKAVMVAMYEPKPRIKKAKFGDKFQISYLHIRQKHRIIHDYDNLVGGSKLLQDALRDMDFIFDDDIEYIGRPKHKQIVGKKNMIIITRTVIQIDYK